MGSNPQGQMIDCLSTLRALAEACLGTPNIMSPRLPRGTVWVSPSQLMYCK